MPNHQLEYNKLMAGKRILEALLDGDEVHMEGENVLIEHGSQEHTAVLNLMLANTCHVRDIESNVQEYSFDLHCRKVIL